MTTTKQYDLLNRLTSVVSSNSQFLTPISYNYAYNTANQRTGRAEADASYWVYQYDSLGQVVSGKKYFSDGTPVSGQQLEYGFDDIGNRTSTKAGGNAAGSALRSAAYSANTLNQYTSRDVPNAFDVLGASHATNSVTVNGSAADYRRGEYFQELVGVVNSSTSVWQAVSVTNSGGGWTTGNVFVAKTPEQFTYDLDGNLTQDGRWTLTWDAENRLIQAESLSSGPTASKRKVTWEYDGKGRRVRQTASDKSSGSYVVTEDLKFISDGWRHIAELNGTNNALIRSYVWGLDLSGSMDGAGGVGGLLMINSAANGAHFYAMDGNGNTAALVKASDGNVSANYEYDPFGQAIRATGAMANENRFCFSTKRTDRTTDFVLYEYRVYKPSTGSWLSRDPIEEQGGLLLYGFVANNPVNYIDPTGQIPLDTIWDIGNIIYDIAVGDYVSLTADVAALAIPYVPAGSTKLVKAAKAADVVSMDSKAIKTLKVDFQYYGNAQGFTKHTLPASAANWVARTKGQASKFMPGWGDAEIKKLIQEALDEAKKKGLLKPGQLNGYVYDAKKTVGASDGCLVKRIEIKINNDGKNLHAYPVK